MRLLLTFGLVAAGATACLFATNGASSMTPASDEPAPQSSDQSSPSDESAQDGSESDLRKATFAGGCFWCTEAVYLRLKGVKEVVSGYAGGTVDNPDYRLICTGTTGHAECVQVTFDPNVITYDQLLDVFFHTHDPTTLNRQGADVGTQYRSSVFYHNDEQKAAAEKMIKELDAGDTFDSPIVTRLEPMEKFWPAEDYHQDYFRLNPGNGYCQVVVGPKVAKFEKRYKALLKTSK